MTELLRNLGVLHVHGIAVDWAQVAGPTVEHDEACCIIPDLCIPAAALLA